MKDYPISLRRHHVRIATSNSAVLKSAVLKSTCSSLTCHTTLTIHRFPQVFALVLLRTATLGPSPDERHIAKK